MAALLAANQSSLRQDCRQELGVEVRDIPRAEVRRAAAADGRVDERAKRSAALTWRRFCAASHVSRAWSCSGRFEPVRESRRLNVLYSTIVDL